MIRSWLAFSFFGVVIVGVVPCECGFRHWSSIEVSFFQWEAIAAGIESKILSR
jgi:hypothetical protein